LNCHRREGKVVIFQLFNFPRPHAQVSVFAFLAATDLET
jgi:hypothetical protein